MQMCVSAFVRACVSVCVYVSVCVRAGGRACACVFAYSQITYNKPRACLNIT